MGDLNDDLISFSFIEVLKFKSDKDEVGLRELYNLMEDMFKKGLGILVWRDGWNLFD